MASFYTATIAIPVMNVDDPFQLRSCGIECLFASCELQHACKTVFLSDLSLGNSWLVKPNEIVAEVVPQILPKAFYKVKMITLQVQDEADLDAVLFASISVLIWW